MFSKHDLWKAYQGDISYFLWFNTLQCSWYSCLLFILLYLLDLVAHIFLHHSRKRKGQDWGRVRWCWSGWVVGIHGSPNSLSSEKSVFSGVLGFPFGFILCVKMTLVLSIWILIMFCCAKLRCHVVCLSRFFLHFVSYFQRMFKKKLRWILGRYTHYPAHSLAMW